MAMGPLATGDLAGLDVGWRIRKEYRHLEDPHVRRPFAEDKLCELGRFGQKTGAGWYRYDEQRRAEPDPAVTALLKEWTEKAGVPQRVVSSDEIVDRCIYALGYGFPSYRGGPMWYADRVGLDKVYNRVCGFHRQFGALWEPAPLLEQLASQGKTFSGFQTGRGVAA